MLDEKYGDWTIIEFAYKKGYNAYYLCKCSCGVTKNVCLSNLKSSKSTNCGCKKRISRLNLIGEKFGRLVVINQLIENFNYRGARWICQCECGNQIVSTSNRLKSGNTKSCGCLNNENRKIIGQNNKIDITGKRFGILIAKSFSHSQNHRALWNCYCDCGNKIVVQYGHLTTGHTQSCGCIKSKGELFISKLLNENNIKYKQQFSFDDLKSSKGYPLKFDFAVFDDNKLIYLIEYCGEQHYRPIDYFGGLESFNTQKDNDEKKIEYCNRKNIQLLIIPHTQDDIVSMFNVVKNESL